MARPPENPFWRFSLAVYGRPGVAEACLALQDRHGLDVNLLLYCLWAGVRGRSLERRGLACLSAAAEPWQQEVVVPLRRLRRALKVRGAEAEKALRHGVKKLELEAERLEQDRLFACLEADAGAPSPTAATENLLNYLEYREIHPDGEDLAALATLIAAGFDGLGRSSAEGLLRERRGPPARP